MASVVVNGDTSGAVTLTAPAVAGTVTVTLPSTSGVMAVGGGTITTLTTTSDITVQGVTVGRGAGAVATNTAVGASALAGSNSGTGQNTAIGSNALVTNTTGANNTSVGYVSLFSNTTGTRNTATGVGALYSNTTGASNSAFSINALNGNTTGSFNVAVGDGALQTNTTASNNTAVGYQAGYSNTTGLYNTFLGNKAGYTFNTSGDTYNTFIGNQSGYSVTTGTLNTFVGGANPGYYVTTGSKNTILGNYTGNQGGLDIRTASNYIVLSDGDGNPRGVCFNTGGWTFSNGGTSDVVGARSGNTAGTANSLYVGYYSATGPTNGTLSFNVTTNGNVTNTNNSYGSLSDIKLKENIVDASPKLADMMQVRVVNYNFKEGQTHKQIGVIAQELEQVFPGMVDESPDRDEEGNDLGTTTKQVKYSVFVPMLIKAIQELKAEVDSLKTQLNGAA